MMMAAYAGNGCLTCGASTHTADNCSWENAMDEIERLERDRELAAEARHGGRVIRDFFLRFGKDADMDNVRYWAKGLSKGFYTQDVSGVMHDFRHRTMLPEAAFDWPIYRRAFDQLQIDEVNAQLNDGDLF
jgi:hypothetical protein